ncbi:MAG: type II toxin-antitoxin system VapC family toxin [Candidatus Rokuibacteriota bacterium]
MILVDSNVPMYLVGAAHPLKADAQRLLERCIAERERLVTDAEVLQEILHCYVAIDRLDAIQPAFDAVLGLVDEVFPVDLRAVERARTIVLGRRRLSARDAIHVAVMEDQGIRRIFSFDSGFDGYPGIERLR